MFIYPRGSSVLSTEIVKQWRPKIWIHLVINEIYEDIDSIGQFKQLVHNFGKMVPDDVLVVLPENGTYAQYRKSLNSFPWIEEIRQDIHGIREPFFLLTTAHPSHFNVENDECTVIPFSKAVQNPIVYDDFLRQLAEAINTGSNIFNWIEKRERMKFIKKLEEVIEAKPGAFGFSIDLKTLISNGDT